MKKAYSYKRWSTVGQGAIDRDSDTRQSNSAKEWMKTHGTRLGYVLSDEVFTDAGKSASKGTHIAVDEFGKAKGDLARFIQSVEQGKIARNSILLVDDYSRFSRLAPFKSLKLFTDVLETGVGIVFTGSYEKRIITQELLNSQEGMGILQMVVGEVIRSYVETDERSRKVRLAKQTLFQNIKNGIVRRNNLPSYFTFIADAGQKSIGTYHHNKNTEKVRLIIKMFLEGKSMHEIADHLNRAKTPTFRYAGHWNATTVRVILQNRLLIGEYKGVQNYVPPITDERTFRKIQTVLEHNQTNRGKKSEYINIFKGICYCTCGKRMNITTHFVNPKTKVPYNPPYRYLRCSLVGRSKVIKPCSNHNLFRLAEMEQEFFLNFLFNTPKQLLNDGESEELQSIKDSIAVNQLKLKTVSAELTKLIQLSAKFTVDELGLQIDTLNKERDSIKDEIDRLTLKASTVEDAPDTFINLKSIVLNGRNVRRHEDVNWEDHKKMFTAIEQVIDGLNDNSVREGIRIMLPPLIGKIVVDAKAGHFYVHNRMGKVVYKSEHYQKLQNCSEKWLEAMSKRRRNTKEPQS